MRPRGLDHVVWPVRDLDAAAALFETLGFTVTPRARHPWGTENRLVQLDGAFLELLTIGGDAAIPDAAPGTLSFGAFNRDFLARGEGGSMIVLESGDAAADRASFEAAGLKVFEPFSFGRTQELSDGTTREVRFDLTFVENPLDASLGYFTCHNLFPENFWSSAYQTHGNGVRALEAVVLTTDEPADQAEFWKAFTGRREMRATSLGITISTPRGDIRIMTPAAYGALFGDDMAPVEGNRLAALVLAGGDVEAIARRAADAGLSMDRVSEGLRLRAADAFGITLVFV
ncbi:VOC family protein [Stappia sp.]|uniref:VOC family protein n=1 Tax=Stappia sp. TaxID=1870903 RepID=UPI0025D898BC|nr:VOC family protein [Stappia sp.]